MKIKFNTVDEALNDLKEGKIIIVTDDEDRENEGDFIVPARFATTENLNFMATYGKGLICMPMSAELAAKLEFAPMTSVNTDNHETAFTVSIDHVETSTGISAHDRSLTAMKVIDESAKPEDFRRPGHMFPLIAKPRGIFERTGHTEATVDLAKLAGFEPAGLCCEIMDDDGTMARLPRLMEIAAKFNLKIITIESLVHYRKSHEQIVERGACANLPTKYGMFKLYAYKDLISGVEHSALVMGEINEDESILCRVHSECLTGDAFGSLKCDCGEQFDAAMKKIAEAGKGVLVYLRQEGRGIGLVNKIKAYSLQDKGLDTVDANLALGLPADARDYNCGIQILKDLGASSLKLMTNNPEKIDALNSIDCGLKIVERIPLQLPVRKHDEFYMRTKAKRMGHLLNL